jgi:hypothetical protein
VIHSVTAAVNVLDGAVKGENRLTGIRKPFFSYDESVFLFMIKYSNYAWGTNIDSINLHNSKHIRVQ